MIKLHLKISFNLKVLQEKWALGFKSTQTEQGIKQSPYLSISHYNTELKITDQRCSLLLLQTRLRVHFSCFAFIKDL